MHLLKSLDISLFSSFQSNSLLKMILSSRLTQVSIFLMLLLSTPTSSLATNAGGERRTMAENEEQTPNPGALRYQIDPSRMLATKCPKTICTERPSSFEFQFLGTRCNQTNNRQDGKFKCLSEKKRSNGSAFISDSGRKGAYIRFIGKYGKVYFGNWVKKGDTFKFNNKNYKFPSDMTVEIFSGGDKAFLLQSISLHTSCSKNLYLGDIFGAVRLVGLYYSNRKNLICEVKKEDENPPPPLPKYIPVPSDAPSVAPSVAPSAAPSNFPSRSPTCTRSLCKESPKVMTFLFQPIAGSCASSINSQDSKFTCNDYNQALSSLAQSFHQYHVLFYKSKKSKSKKSSKSSGVSVTTTTTLTLSQAINEVSMEELFFSGPVSKGGLIDIKADAGNSDKKKIPADMTVKIYEVGSDESMTLIQALTFHSSCSQNLYIGDSFGSFELVGLEYNSGMKDFCVF